MNVPYNQISAKDSAKMIGIDYSTVAGWCRKNIINYNNVGDGTKMPRYVLDEKEVGHLKKLKKQYGTRKLLLYYKKDWNKKEMIKSIVTDISTEVPDEWEVNKVPVDLTPTRKPFDKDNIVTTICYIQDIKERLNDIEAERNQLINEWKDLQKELMGYIDVEEFLKELK